MKFVIEKNILLDAIINVSRAISTRTTIPILNGIKFELKNDGLYLTATDSELTIKIFIEEKKITKIESIGSVVIQSKYILDIIRKMPTNVINFEVINNNNIKISSDYNEYELNCYDVSDYPNVLFEEGKEPVPMKSSLLKHIINNTSYAISNQEVRPLLTGLNLKITGDNLECIATDSYRLAKMNVKLDRIVENIVNIVIPGKSVLEIEKILSDEEDEIVLHIFNNKLIIVFKNIEIQTNLLSGTYPDTSHFIPNEFKYVINIDLNTFNAAVDRATILAQNKDKNIVKMVVNGKEMILSTSSNELGKTEEKLMIESSCDEYLDIAFSSKYMLDALKVFKDNDLIILLNADDKPILIKSLKDDSTLGLILPVKTY